MAIKSVKNNNSLISVRNSAVSMKICKLFKFRLKNLNIKLFFKNLDLERFPRAYIPKYNQNGLMKTCKKSRFCDFGKILEILAFSDIEHESGKHRLREKCPNTEFSLFCIFPHSD